MRGFVNIIDTISERVGKIACWLMLAVVLIGAFNAVARWIGREAGADLSSNAFIELQWYLFGCIFFLGGAHTLRVNGHVRVDVVYDRLSKRVAGWIDLVGHVVLLIPFCVFMIYVSWGPVAESFRVLEQSPDPAGLPRYPIKALIPFAFALLLLQAVAELARRVQAKLEGKELEASAEESAEPEPQPPAPEPEPELGPE